MERYDVRDTADFLCTVRSTAAALQFPDDLLGDSPDVVTALAAELRSRQGPGSGPLPRLAVLGDTSFGACCVDEVAAAHMPADAIIHYGPSCLSAPTTLPVLHVLEKSPIDASAAARVVCDVADKADGRVLLLSDTAYAHALPSILRSIAEFTMGAPPDYDPVLPRDAAALSTGASPTTGSREALLDRFTLRLRSPLPEKLFVPSFCRVAFPPASNSCCPATSASRCCQRLAAGDAQTSSGDRDEEHQPSNSAVSSPPCEHLAPLDVASSRGSDCGSDTGSRVIHVLGMDVTVPRASPQPPSPGEAASSPPFHSIVYVGHRASRLRAVTAQFGGGGAAVWAWDPRGEGGGMTTAPVLLSAATGRFLSRRYRTIEAIRGASIVGVVAGTLGVARHEEVLAALREGAAAAGKALYTFLVGKLSPSKLGNFPEVDAWVLVACPECSILEEAEAAGYGAPLATPQEALIGLLPPQDGEARRGDGGDASSSLVWSGACEFHFPALLRDFKAALQRHRASGATEGGDAHAEEGDGAFLSLVSGGKAGGTGQLLRHARPWARQAGKSVAQRQQQEGGGEGEPHPTPPGPPRRSTSATALLAPDAGPTFRALALARNGPNAGAGAAYLATQRQWRGVAYDYSDALQPSVAPVRAAADEGVRAEAALEFDGTDPEALALALAAQPAPGRGSAAALPPTHIVQGAVGRAMVYQSEV